MGRRTNIFTLAVGPFMGGVVTLFVFRPRPSANSAPVLTAEAKSYVRNLKLSEVSMKATESYVGQMVTEVAADDASAPVLQLRFSGDSWIEVLDREGRILEQDTPGASAQRSWPLGSVSQVTLGNAAAVQASQRGRVLDLTPYQRANRARFTLSLDGSLTPAFDR